MSYLFHMLKIIFVLVDNKQACDSLIKTFINKHVCTFVCLVPGPVGRLSFTEILDTSLKVSWEEPVDKNGIITGEYLVFFNSFIKTILYILFR